MSEENSALNKVLAKAAQMVTPSENEVKKLSSVESEISKRLEQSFAGLETKPENKLGGSYARGTWLHGSADIDFFLMYPEDFPRDRLEGEAIVASRNAVKGYTTNMRYAEHPYVEAFVREARVNLVPCYKVKPGMWKSAADRSPFHTEYIQKHFNDKLRLETRLLKKFVKTAGVYGAEVRVHGFSGYVCEVLTLALGSFQSVLSRLSNLKRGEIFSLEPYDKDFARTFRSPIIILDPVDSTRNLGTAISAENLSRLILQSRSFLARPSIQFFQRKAEPRREKLSEEILTRILVLSFKTRPRSVDILWGQLHKSVDSLSRKMESWDFNVLRKQAASNEKDESAFIFLLLETKISKYQIRKGPEVFRNEDFAKYMGKNQKRALLSWLDSEGRTESVFERQRDSSDVFKLMRKVLKNRKALDSLGLSRAVKEEIRNFKIQTGSEILRKHPGGKDWLRNEVISIASEEEAFHATA